MVSLTGHSVPNTYPTLRKGTTLIAAMDPEVKGLWDQMRTATGDESKRLMDEIVAAGKRQRGEA